MPDGSARGPHLRDIESPRIERPATAPTRRRLTAVAMAITVSVTILALGYYIYSLTLGRPLQVRTALVSIKTGDKPAVLLTGSGYIVTQHKYIVIGTKVLGQIVEEPIEEGQRVHKGDLLARIDDRDYQAQLREAVADRDLAAANVALKRAQAARARELFRNQTVSQDQFEIAENALAVAAAELQRALGAIAYASFNVSQCVIKASIDGIVLKKYRELGDTINYGGDIQAGGGTTDIAQLADTNDLRAEVDISETDIAKVTMGQPAAVIPDAYPDQSFAAFVAKIYPAADRQKGTIEVEAKLRNPDIRIIKPEMSTKVIFLTGEEQRAATPTILVPKKAIVADGAASAVWVVREGTASCVAITIGRELQDGVEVRSGLDGGELVIVEPTADLKNGSAVITAGP